MKEFGKTILLCLSTLAAVPVWVLHALLVLLLGRQRACQWISQLLARRVGLWGEYVRRAGLRPVLARVGRDVVIGWGTLFSKPAAELGDGVYIGSHCSLGDVRIGPETMIADGVRIPSGAGQHGIAPSEVPMRQQEGEFRTIHIGEDCWIGSGAVVLADVGDHSIVAAGAVVTRPVEPWSIVAGNPARPIGDRRDKAQSQPGQDA